MTRMFSKPSHDFKDDLGQTYAFALHPQFDAAGTPRHEAVIRSKVYARQTLDSIAASPDDPLNYGLLDLWLEVYQKPWAQPRSLRSLIDDLADKVASGELFVYLEDSPVWHFQSSGLSINRTFIRTREGVPATGSAAEDGVVDAARTQG